MSDSAIQVIFTAVAISVGGPIFRWIVRWVRTLGQPDPVLVPIPGPATKFHVAELSAALVGALIVAAGTWIGAAIDPGFGLVSGFAVSLVITLWMRRAHLNRFGNFATAFGYYLRYMQPAITVDAIQRKRLELLELERNGAVLAGQRRAHLENKAREQKRRDQMDQLTRLRALREALLERVNPLQKDSVIEILPDLYQQQHPRLMLKCDGNELALIYVRPFGEWSIEADGSTTTPLTDERVLDRLYVLTKHAALQRLRAQAERSSIRP